MRIKAQLHYMADSEIMNMISPNKYAEIKAKDSKPIFKAFVIGHEGEAKARMVGIGAIIKTWFRSAVEKLHNKIQMGIKLFHGHSATNEQDGRVPIGEIIGKQLKLIDDKLSSVVACWLYPDFKNMPLDVASIEAGVEFEGNETTGYYVADVGDVSGVALGNSKVDTPGFPNATLLGQIQAFAENKKIGDIQAMTPEEIKKAILEAGLQPSDVFTKDGLTADPLIVEHVREKTANPEGYHIRKLQKDLVEAEGKAAKAEADKKIVEELLTKQSEDIKSLKSENAVSKVGTLFETEKTKRKLEGKVVKYIQSRLPSFKVNNPEEIEKEFSTYLDSTVDEFKTVAKDVFEIEDKPADPNIDLGPEGDKDTPDNKYLDPAQNPMIPTEVE